MIDKRAMYHLCNLWVIYCYFFMIASFRMLEVKCQLHNDYLRRIGNGPSPSEREEVSYYGQNGALGKGESRNQPQQQEEIENQQHQSIDTVSISNTNNDVSELRYVVFGTSVSWGSGLEDRNNSFPYLLSPNVKNLALRACGPNYPSVCTQSMVGNEDIYDVVVLEYMTGSQDGLYPLARRVRQRFPNAVIIFICLWYPLMLYYEDEGSKVPIQKWMTSHLGLSDYKSKIDEQIIPKLKSSELPWKLDTGFIEKKIKYASEIAREVSGYVFFGPNEWIEFDQISQEYNFKSQNVINDLLLPHYKLFNEDWLHLSKEGHQLVSQRIHSLLQKIIPNDSKSNNVDSRNILGTWGKGDACYSWYETGIDILKHSDDVKMENFQRSANAKYALNFPIDSSSTLLIPNPFSESRELIISYMATGPETRIYPITEIQLYNLESGYISPTIYINPLCKDYPHDVHVVQSKVITLIPPGNNKLLIQPIRDENNMIRNTNKKSIPFFRIVAISITDGNLLPSKNFHGPASLVNT